MDKKLEEFIIRHTSPEDPLLEELYRQTHIRFVNPNMASGHPQGKFLEFISRMISPMKILELGTFTGYSAICLARGLKPGGILITVEINDELTDFAHDYFMRAGLGAEIIQLTGRAQDILPELDHEFDLIFIDADKREYSEYYSMAVMKLSPGGFILADNVFWGGQAIERQTNDPQTAGIVAFNEMIMKDKTTDKIMLPLRDGVMLIRKKQ